MGLLWHILFILQHSWERKPKISSLHVFSNSSIIVLKYHPIKSWRTFFVFHGLEGLNKPCSCVNQTGLNHQDERALTQCKLRKPTQNSSQWNDWHRPKVCQLNYVCPFKNPQPLNPQKSSFPWVKANKWQEYFITKS